MIRAIDKIKAAFKRSILIRKNPTCRFYGPFLIEASKLGVYTTYFENVYIADSVVGDYTFVQRDTNLVNAQIGKFCSIAGGARIGLGEHPLDMVSTHPAFYSASQPLARTFSDVEKYGCYKRTVIGHDVWIGERALIKDGVNIGTGAVIGAGAVVTKDVPAYAVVGGVPAVVIKYRFDGDIIGKLLVSEWWDKPAAWLERNFNEFVKPEGLLSLLENHKKDGK